MSALVFSEALDGGVQKMIIPRMRRLTIPAEIGSTHIYALLGLIDFYDGDDDLEIDFQHLTRLTPGAATALAVTMDRWKFTGRTIHCKGLEECFILPQLQRMGLLRCLGVPFDPEPHALPKGKWVSLRPIQPDVDSLASEIAECFAPGGEDYVNPASELFDLIQYLISEISNNVVQHSQGNGFATAQMKSTDGLARISIADNGLGILGSFRKAGFKWACEADDVVAITQALKPQVSSKGPPINAGVGLTMVHEIVTILGGWMAVASGNGYALTKPGTISKIDVQKMPDGAYFKGTLLAIAFKTEDVSNWATLLERAKINAGLLPPGFSGGIFSP